MSARVLDVLDEVAGGMGGPTDLGLSEARAAVAELIRVAAAIHRSGYEMADYCALRDALIGCGVPAND